VIVLDTNVLSEMLRPKPARQVESWMAAQPPAMLFLTAVTQAEILYGLALLDDGKRRNKLSAAIKPIFDEDFAERILPFDADAAIDYAAIAGARRSAGRPISQFDAQIAAIVRSRGATLATRNTRDFEGCGIDIVDPWMAD
jgi:hypothetical protein